MPVIEGGQVLRGGQDFGGVLGGQVIYGGQEVEPEQGGRTQPDSEAVEMSVGPFRRSGAPPNGWYNGVADKGAIAVDVTTGTHYANTGTKAATVWTPLGASGDVVTIAAAAPLDPVEGQLWARQLAISGGYQLYRFTGGELWQALGAGVGAGATDGPFEDARPRQVGTIVGDPDDGYFAGLEVNTSDGFAYIKYESADGATSAKVECTPTSLRLSYLGTSHFPTILMDENGLQVYGLPAADPVITGALWSDGGTLKISAG